LTRDGEIAPIDISLKSEKASRRRRGVFIYILLVIASCFAQLIREGDSAAESATTSLMAPAFDASGPIHGMQNRVSFDDLGEGDPVILLHGSPGSRRDFDHLVPLLSDRFRTIAVDLPGFGGSDRWIPDYSIRGHARSVLAVMDQSDVDRAHVVGFSMGSGVALNMADLAPERIRSLTMIGGIGIQEGEGSGDYRFEHRKYAIGYALLVVAPELVPHFGLLGSRAARHSFIRNFLDSDQRPLRGVLEEIKTPLLILHGRHDPLVHSWVAEEHHRMVEHSALVMLDSSHFMLFSNDGSKQIAEWLVPFLEAHASAEAEPVRTTIDLCPPLEPAELPLDLHVSRSAGPWVQMAALVAGTMVSEDLACITSGLLIRQSGLDPFVAVLGCTIGIFLGDVLLLLLGRFAGRRIFTWGPVVRRLSMTRMASWKDWIENHAGKLVLASRFMPGTRVPMYIAAGVLGRSSVRFVFWLLLAAVIWTPLLIATSAVVGPAVVRPLERVLGHGWAAFGVGAVLVLVLLRSVERVWSRVGRARMIAAVSRLWRWEFWPMWLFYLPLIPWWIFLVIRYRGITTPTAVNPAIPAGGVVGESKWDILRLLPQRWVVPTERFDAGTIEERMARFETKLQNPAWRFPLIFKPDVGQRGRGLKLIRSLEQAAEYFRHEPSAVLIQQYHAGPHEAGVFYYRMPGEPLGRIFSITDKVFPRVMGDGTSTLEELIWRDARLRMQAETFLARHAEQRSRVPASGEVVRLAVAGNHCQGTMFRDGAQLITPKLEGRIDEIARSVPGFSFGRFDIRYADPEAFCRGEDLNIVELNGVTSESTNIYDPAWSLARAYLTLMRQWRIAFRIGWINRRNGVPVTRFHTLAGLIVRHYRGRTSRALSD